MGDSKVMSVIQMWAAVAWADGVLAEAEADGLRRLIRTAELSADERALALTLLDREVPLPDAYLENLTPDARRGIYRAACRMAIVDHVFTATERSMLDRLRDHLAITDEAAHEIEADIPGLA